MYLKGGGLHSGEQGSTLFAHFRPIFGLSLGLRGGLSKRDPKLPALLTVAAVGPSPWIPGLFGMEPVMMESEGIVL